MFTTLSGSFHSRSIRGAEELDDEDPLRAAESSDGVGVGSSMISTTRRLSSWGKATSCCVVGMGCFAMIESALDVIKYSWSGCRLRDRMGWE